MTSQTVLGYTDRENVKRYMRSSTINYLPVWKNKRNSELYDDVMIQFDLSHIIGDIVADMQIFNNGGMIQIENFNTAFTL
ncbi:hypothetical protein Bp8pC_176 [Bacillus phage Bp8p-C]|uniref:Uncharacterized protein n=2 Tax=Agatevirus Bp8pC TaxID=1910937 RepID=A0A0A0PUW5_9CAUD|nr:hypothetical protein AXJ20_gp172 [Bacillus phage Bp8p-C]YP_009784476.1 hypothetical protein QLX39_gp172 [Bacillus phage Bp8p-T]AHJ87606.1 hypothetical protein Bp8pC_176 [Bacillus phage Bp8p-C]AHJ87817.1 hypothetical protein Bp8pT_176 [Bacillus phage Bp8p-T]